MPRPPGQGLVALLTDFGTRDWYVPSLKGVIASRLPRVRLVDLTHEVPPQDVRAGALILAAAAPWFPRGTVILAVVDPGVGTERPLVAARVDGRYVVGPDNGLLSLSLERARDVVIVQLTNRRYWLHPVSHTFHARDVLAPAAAHLAAGGALSLLGGRVSRVRSLALAHPRRQGRTLGGHILHLDAFGNLITDLPASALVGRDCCVRYRGRKVRVVSSYAAGRPGELIALAGSVGLVELAVRNGSAARHLRARRGERVELSG